MRRFEKVLLASDMDGTLLNSSRLVSRENREALRWFTEQGGHFCVATGRAVEVTVMYFNDYPVNAPYVCLNGALVYAPDGTLLRHNAMPAETPALLEAAREVYPGIGVEVYVKEKAFILHDHPMTQHHFKILGIEPPRRALSELPPCTEWSKMNLTGEPEKIALVQKRLEEFSGQFSTASAMPIFCEVTAANATKGEAVAQAAQLCGIAPENVFVAGDSANDLSMVRKFYAFAPENSEECVLQAANEVVCDNDHYAVAAMIEALSRRFPE